MRALRLGTRGSALALAQARWIARELLARLPDVQVEIEVIRTAGDVDARTPLHAMGSQGVFVRELERALQEGRIDAAVHSLKDLPSTLPDGLTLGAIPPREDPRDALVGSAPVSLEALPQGARVGTGSPRRHAQLRRARPDLQVAALRGNVDTRLRRVREGRVDAAVLAMAGLRRLGLVSRARPSPLDPAVCTPAAGQGALALEVREDDTAVLEAVGLLDHAPTRLAVETERAWMRSLGAGCLAPATAFAEASDSSVRLRAVIAHLEGSPCVVREMELEPVEAATRAAQLALQMLDSGGAAILDSVRRLLEATGPGPESPSAS